MAVSDPYRELERVRGERARHLENSARHAQAWGFGITTGQGESRFAERINFGLAFIEEPAVTYGYAVNDVKTNSDLGDALVDGRFPRCVGGVYDWEQDSRGFYLGAWTFVVVSTNDPFTISGLPEPGYTIRHTFGFSGTAFKALLDRLGEDF